MSDVPPPTTADPFGGRSALRQMALGSAWMVAMRWCIRGMGLVSTLILVRLLLPEDFGVVAVAMVVVGFMETLRETGQRLAILRLPAPSRDDYDTAWTLSILIGLAVSLLILALALPAAAFYGDPRVAPVIAALALRPLLGGFENIGTIDFQRHFHYGRDFVYGLAQKAVSIGTTLVAVLILGNYWALVAGIVAGTAAHVVLSFILSPYRPRPTLSAWRSLLSFSLWNLGIQLGRVANSTADRVMAGRWVGAAGTGIYTVAAEVAVSFLQEIFYPIARALMPVYARIAHDRAELAAKYRIVLAALGHVCLSVGIGIALVSGHAVPVLLGPGWDAAAPVMAWLAVASGLQLLGGSVLTVLNAVGLPRRGAILNWVQLIVLVPALALGLAEMGIVGAAMARAAVALLFLPISLLTITRCLDTGLYPLLKPLLRPMLAAAAMAAILLGLDPAGSLPSPLLALMVEIAIGGTTYILAALLLWLMAGRPDGVERALLAELARRLRPVPNTARSGA